MPQQLKSWFPDDRVFMVLRDQDSADCIVIKKNLQQKCIMAGKPETLVRVACHELESWYLGDLNAVENALKVKGIAKRQRQRIYRNPDSIESPSKELHRLAPCYQKVSGSRAIGKLLDIDKNTSKSFKVLIAGINTLLAGI